MTGLKTAKITCAKKTGVRKNGVSEWRAAKHHVVKTNGSQNGMPKSTCQYDTSKMPCSKWHAQNDTSKMIRPKLHAQCDMLKVTLSKWIGGEMNGSQNLAQK